MGDILYIDKSNYKNYIREGGEFHVPYSRRQLIKCGELGNFVNNYKTKPEEFDAADREIIINYIPDDVTYLFVDRTKVTEINCRVSKSTKIVCLYSMFAEKYDLGVHDLSGGEYNAMMIKRYISKLI